MASPRSSGSRESRTSRSDVEDQVGHRLRARREQRQLSLRELARRLELSPAAVSQIETGKSRPSMRTLFAIVRELDMSLDELFSEAGDETPELTQATRRPSYRKSENDHRGPGQEGKLVQRAGSRSAIDLETGVRWERLTPPHMGPHLAFLYVSYEVGGSSSRDDALMRHGGQECGLVLSGTLEVTVGSERYELGPGDSICFDSTVPHRVRNIGNETAHGVWFGIGRQRDSRVRALHEQDGAPGPQVIPGDEGASGSTARTPARRRTRTRSSA